MALQNDPRLFTGGGERVDTRPHVQLYAQLMQRKQAKEDALDQYYQNLHKSVNPAGMRTKDIEGGWSQKLNDFTAFGIENKKAISNPKTPEDRVLANRFMGMYQDLQMDTSKSKEASAMEMELAKQKISGKWNPTQDDLDVASSIGSSIYDPKYYKDPDIRTKPYSLADLSLNIPQVTPKEQEEYYKAAVGNLKPKEKYDETKARRDKVTGQVFVPFESSYEADQVKKVSENAGVLFPGNRTPIGVHYEKLLHDPRFFEEANAAFQSVYGPDAIVDTPKKAAQAAAIMNTMADISTGEKAFKDEDLAFQKQKDLAAYRHGLAVALKKTPGAKPEGSEDDQTYIIDWWRDKTRRALSGPENLTNILKGGGYKLPMDAITGKAFARQGLEPKEIFVEEKNGETIYTPQYFDLVPKTDANGKVETGKDGKPIMVEQRIDDLSQPMSEADALLNLGVKMVTGKPRTKEGQAAVRGQQQQSGYSNQQPATYKGKKITAGVKNGKWYNIQTGEELK